MDILHKLAESAADRVRRDRSAVPRLDMVALASAQPNPNFAFERAIASPDMSLICEIKRASPSKGMISQNFPYLDIAREYESGGAAAISVLTEPTQFLGCDTFLSHVRQVTEIPLLRKDFTVDDYQIYQARALGASAVLLICSLLDTARLRGFIDLAHTLGLSALVEAHDEREIESAQAAGARIIGVNNRDLRTFSVDAATCLRLRRYIADDVLFVAESGVNTRADIIALERGGADAALVGERLMRSDDRAAAIRELLGAACGCRVS
ncbi:MAG: indole-3-glycerol phosphate synthase TrpC [Oscillospiraceae bacterium]|nr:indole-3-glycerol phosphate synthase TrpC [Oscillospiraceae bacterium]